jgi:hypothetical protein
MYLVVVTGHGYPGLNNARLTVTDECDFDRLGLQVGTRRYNPNAKPETRNPDWMSQAQRCDRT